MTDINAKRAAAIRARYDRQPYLRSGGLHKYAIGEIVAISGGLNVVRTKNMQIQQASARFEIKQRLPEQDRSLQYRVRNTVTGQERVVAEESILGSNE